MLITRYAFSCRFVVDEALALRLIALLSEISSENKSPPPSSPPLYHPLRNIFFRFCCRKLYPREIDPNKPKSIMYKSRLNESYIVAELDGWLRFLPSSERLQHYTRRQRYLITYDILPRC